MDHENDFVRNEIKNWHPESRPDFIGERNRRQDDRWHRNAIERRLPMLSLLIGPYGCGKTERARYIIKTIRCRHRTADGSPCYECDDCIRQGPEFNGDGFVYKQWEVDCSRISTKAELLSWIEDIERAERPLVFFDQLEGLNEKGLRLLLTFLDNFKGVFIGAITDVDFRNLQQRVRAMPAFAPVFERLRKVYLSIPGTDEMVAFFRSKLPKWGVTADDEMLRLLVTASQRSFRTCLDVLQAARENDPPVLDRATIEEFLTLDDTSLDDSPGMDDEEAPGE